MGMWKRVSEKAKQTFGVKANAVDWKPTSNARNLAMLDEVKRFSKQLKTLHRELRDMEGHIESNFGVLKVVLSSPMPRAFANEDRGAVPVCHESTIVGNGVAFEVLHMTVSDLKRKLQDEVLKPLDEWQAVYKQIKIRNLKCEELRLELDAKRRETSAMAAALERQKNIAAAKGDKTLVQMTGASAQMTGEASMRASSVGAGVTGGPASKWEDADFRLQKEDDKVTRLSQRYGQIEYEVYSALVTLIQDTMVLRQYAASAMLVYQNAFAQAYTAFGPLPAPEPVSTSCHMAPDPEMCPGPSDRSTPDKMAQSVCQEPQGDTKAAPDTPTAPSGQPSPPAWYAEARQQATPMKYDSDDDS